MNSSMGDQFDAQHLKAWARKVWKAKEEVLSHIGAKPEPSLLDTFTHIKNRLTVEGQGGTISNRVLKQLRHTERAYKGWETRRNKEQDNAGDQSGQRYGEPEVGQDPERTGRE